MLSIIWLMVLLSLLFNATAKLSEFSLDRWLMETFVSSSTNMCDDSQQGWALNALRFKNSTEKLRHLDLPEPCTETREGGLKYLYFKEFVRKDSVKVPFRVFRDSGLRHICKLYAGTFVRGGSALYSVSNSTLVHVVNITKIKNKIDVRLVSESRHSLFMNITKINKVPGFQSALDDANDGLSVQEGVIQDGISPSNTAILLLPVLLSFVPVSLMSNEISRSRVIVFAIATDFITNIPVLIKGAELLYIASVKHSATKSVAFKTGTAALQVVEIWVTKCSKGLYAHFMGTVFLLLGTWSIVVGLLTEFIAWKFVLESRITGEEPETKRLGNSNSKGQHMRTEEGVVKRQSTRRRTEGMEGEHAKSTMSSASLNSLQDSQDITTVTISSTEEPDDQCLPTNSDDERGAIVFFFLGIFLSALLLLPFLALLLLRFEVFKRTEKREYFFKIGIMTGSVNLTFVYMLSNGVPLAIFVLIFDFLLTLALQRRTAKFWHFIRRKGSIIRRRGSIRPAAQASAEREPGQLKFFFFGFGLGLLVSLFSMIYVLCFPGIQDKKTKKRFFKYGCLLGALNNLIFLELLVRLIFGLHTIDNRPNASIFAFNAALILSLIIIEKISP